MRYLVDFIYLIVLILYSPVLLYRVLLVGKDRRGWGERLGGIPRRTSDRRLVWIHAVSVGEANATVTLVEQLRAALPDFELAVSTTTDTGAARAAQLYPAAIRFHFPLDLSCAVRRVFNRLRPSVIVLIELEVWPNLTAEARRRGVPVMVANGRLTAKAVGRYGMIAGLVRPMFTRLAAVCAQEQTYAARFAQLGVPADRITVTGSVKYDTATVADRVAGQDELAAAMGLQPDHLMLIAGSTGPGEEEILLRVYAALRSRHEQLRLAIVPRKPERFAEVADLIARQGFHCWRRSEHKEAELGGGPRFAVAGQLGRDEAGPSKIVTGDLPWPADCVVLGDTMGELRKFYALAAVAFVGRSLTPLGGSDVMEVAALGKGVLVGPHTANFAEPVERLSAAGGLIVVNDGEELRAIVEQLLSDPARRLAMAAAARQAVIAAQGATARTVEVIRRLVEAAARNVQCPMTSDQ